MMDFPDSDLAGRPVIEKNRTPRPSLMATLRQGARMMWRDARAGELRLLIWALVVAVAAVTSVGFLADRVGQALTRDASQMLGADLLLEADAPVAQDQIDAARQRGLEVSRTWQFPSMASAGDAAQLVSVKAVEAGYPLRGSLRVAVDPVTAGELTNDIPAAGTVWVDAQLLALLNIGVGDSLGLGDSHFRVSRVITYEPDRGMQFVNVAPRVLMRADELEATGLVTLGSRVGHALLVAGDPNEMAAYSSWLQGHLQKGQKIATVESGRPEVQRTLDRAQRFLALVALLAVLISAVAVALAAGRFMVRHRDGIAVMRCLGAEQRQITLMLLAEFVLVGLCASAAGGLLGYAVHEGLVYALGNLIDTELPAPSLMPALQGLVTGILLLLGFALPSLAQLRHVPPARVLRREADGGRLRGVLGYALGAVGFALLIWWFAGNARLGGVVAAGFLGAFGAFALVAWLCVLALARLRGWAAGMPTLRFALAGVVRRRAATITQVCALAVGLMALLLLAMTRTDLVAGWQRTLPADAPNRFLINIQPDQREPVQNLLATHGIDHPTLWPMVRGRLVAVDGRQVGPDDYDEPRAKRLVNREFNLSYGTQLPAANRVVDGRWLNPNAPEVSLEAGLAKSLGIGVGSVLTFDVAGQPIDVTVAGTRSVDWDSMQVNFFAVLSPVALRDAPQNWITSFHLPADRADLPRELLKQFPNLTVFDVGSILSQLQSVLDQVITAVQLLFVFTLAAGVLVLSAALTATRDERIREAAVLRALGATRSQLARAQRLEVWAVGGLAGLLAAAGASAIAWALSTYVFDFRITLSLWPWLAGIGVGILAAWGGAAMALRGVLRTPPLLTLRQAG
ncbi:ABC transporter permease [Bordetella sp. 15P40C-2]|uniref:ABC transporter permease n=1 Tax=Bordetella sp. 15P40C-2 TaxID=2572246 RepID=UPI00351BDB21